MTEHQKNEIRAVLRSLQEDLDNATTEAHKAEAVRNALIVLLDTLADNN